MADKKLAAPGAVHIRLLADQQQLRRLTFLFRLPALGVVPRRGGVLDCGGNRVVCTIGAMVY